MNFPAWIPFIGPILGRRRAYRELPELARRHGLRLVESDQKYLFGIIEGIFRDYPVQISPHTPSVSVKLNCKSEDFKIMTLDTNQKPPQIRPRSCDIRACLQDYGARPENGGQPARQDRAL